MMIQLADIREWRTQAVLDPEAVFRHYGLDYQPGAGGERRLARR